MGSTTPSVSVITTHFISLLIAAHEASGFTWGEELQLDLTRREEFRFIPTRQENIFPFT
jgi:hypothetical protein